MRSTVLIFVAISFASCGGGGAQSNASPAAGPSAGGGRVDDLLDDGTPRWVTRGGGAIGGAGGRVFYGVASAAGIKNPALLRSTAEDRARADLAKVIETFSKALMKDYQASNGEQAVTQVIETVTKTSLKGVVIADHYITADGDLYALAKLDLRVVANVLRGEEMGAAKSHSAALDVEAFFDAGAKSNEPPLLPSVGASDIGGASAPSGAGSGAKTRSGAKPAWVDGVDPAFPRQRWLCAVGYGPERSASENAGFGALSRVFAARVQSVSRDFMGAYQKTGAQSIEVQSTESLTEVVTSSLLSGVQILEVWNDGATHYALACMERGPAAKVLTARIAEADTKAAKYLDSSASLDKASRLRALAKALDTMREREVLNGELRIVDANGIGVRASRSHVDVAAAFEAAIEALKVGVVATGPYNGDFRGALIEGLAKRGFKTSDGESADMDVLVTATIRIEDAGKGTGRMEGIRFARGVIRVEIKNVAKNEILGSIDESRKDGSRNREEAERRVVRALAKKLSNKIGAKIEKAMLQ